jgi:cold shock CspA family protein
MKYFGTVKAFDNDKGFGSIKSETGGDDLQFERNAISWDVTKSPTIGLRLSYDVGTKDAKPCALNLQTI